MAQLALYFSGYPHPQLRSSLYSDGRRGIRGVRGKTGGAYASSYESCATFQWTVAVKALSVLVLRHAAKTGAVLEGKRGSLAASLDQSLEKQTVWLCEFFGTDSRGEPVARRLIKRSNPGGRLPGPVALAISESILPSSDITVYLDDVKVSQSEELVDLARVIETGGSASTTASVTKKAAEEPEFKAGSSAQIQYREDRGWLTRLVLDQASAMLSYTDIFDRQQLLSRLRRIHANSYFQKLSGNAGETISYHDIKLSCSGRLGIVANDLEIRRALCRDDPLTIAIPAVLAGPVAILKYLVAVKGYNISINYRFPHSTELLQCLLKERFTEDFDFCVLSVGNTAALLGKKGTGYRPFMLLPSERYAVVAPKGSCFKNNGAKEYLFITEAPSAQAYFFEELSHRGIIEVGSRVNCRHAEPDEATAALMSGDSSLRAILCFPHYHFNNLFNDCVVSEEGDTSNFLCCHERVWRDPQRLTALDIAIRDAWIELSLNPSLLQKVVESLVAEDYFCSVLTRAGGLHYISAEKRRLRTELAVSSLQ